MAENPPKDYLWLHLREVPYFRSLMRAIEASFYPPLRLPRPLLDIGSGDGHFVTVAFDQPLEVGIDPAEKTMAEARRRGGYRWLVRGEGGALPFPDGSFAAAMSNSVLEHIPAVEQVLAEVQRVLLPGAPFAFCGPNPRFLEALSIANWLDRLGWHDLAQKYRAFFNRLSRHHHADPPQVWQARLERNGFVLERYWHYCPPQTLQAIEWGHYFGLPSLLIHKITGRWILVPQRWNLALTERYARRYYRPAPCEDGVCTFYVARRL